MDDLLLECLLACDVRLTDNQTLQWIIGCRDPDATTCGIYVESGEFIIKFNDNVAQNEVLGVASIGDNSISYSGTGTLDFVEPIGVIGCLANQNTPKEFLTGFVTKLLLVDTNPSASATLDSRSYTGIVSKTREETEDEPPELIPPDNSFLIDDNNVPVQA